MNISHYKKRISPGFSLAEVLINLAVIGIVTALSIPSIQLHIKKQEYVVPLKKFYTEFNQALQQMAIDKGCANDLKCTGITDLSDKQAFEIIKDYLSLAKYCPDSKTGCWGSETYKGLNNTDFLIDFDTDHLPKALTTNGFSIHFNNWGGCNSQGKGVSESTCGNIYVDINGPKKPNILGRDTFAFNVTQSCVLYPRGGKLLNNSDLWKEHWDNNTWGHGCISNGDGSTCAGKIMEESWEMNY